MSDLDEIVDEFIIESLEGLDQVDAELLRLEEFPDDAQTLQSIFRTIHSMKGACGFLEFDVLQSVAHAGENLLDALRDGKLAVDDSLTTTLLEMNDAIRSILGAIQESGSDKGGSDYTAIVDKLHAALSAGASADHAALEPLDLEERSGDEQDPEEPEGAPAPASPSATPGDQSPAGDSSAALAARSASESSIRLRVDQLDALMNLAGELVLARNQVVQQSVDIDDTATHATAQRLSRITTELQEGIMKIRMQPVSTLINKLPRIVRGMAKQLGKEVELVITGAETEVDKTLLEAIKDPLTHLVRNSLDHGIESPNEREAVGKPRKATLGLSAFHESGEVNIVVKDDGRGIDPETIRAKAVERGLYSSKDAAQLDDRAALELLFEPGFSTAKTITNISGRGVGMDVVRRNLECVGGTVEIESEIGKGTQVIIRIPLTLAIIPALTVHSGGNRYAIPQANLVELLRVESGDELGIEEVFGSRVFRLRGDLLHLVSLNEQLGTTPASGADDDAFSVVVVQSSGRTFGLIVDGIYESEEIVVKPLDRVIKSLQAYAGTTILADGQVALILDVAGLAERASLMTDGELLRVSRHSGYGDRAAQPEGAAPIEYLVASIGEDRRVAMKLSHVDRLEEVDPATVEKAGTLRFIQYRGDLLQLIDVGQAMGVHEAVDSDQRVLKTIVRSTEDSSFGLIVTDVLDIIEVPANEKPHGSPDAAIESVLVVGGQVTEVIDEAWVAATFGAPKRTVQAAEAGADLEPAADQEKHKGDSIVQLCTFRLGSTLYGIDVLDVQEVLMPQQRTPIPLSPPEFEGLLNLRGDTVLALDLGSLLAVNEEGSGDSIPHEVTDQMNVVICADEGSLSILVDEVGEVMDLPTNSFEPCPPAVSAAQLQVASGVFKLRSELLIHLDVGELYRLVSQSQLAARA